MSNKEKAAEGAEDVKTDDGAKTDDGVKIDDGAKTDGDTKSDDDGAKADANEAVRVAKARPAGGDDAGEHHVTLPPPPKKLLRTAYWALWFVLTPFALSCILVWALTPPSGIDHGGALGWIDRKSVV